MIWCANLMGFLVFWCILAPITFICFLINLPVRMFKKIMGLDPVPFQPQVEVQVTESDLPTPKGELFFIHGFPDTGELWNK